LEFREVVRRRRMVRRFEQRPLPPELLDRVLESAMHAPSAGFSQGTTLVVLDRPEAVERFWATIADPAWEHRLDRSAGPPVLVLVLSDKQAYLDRYGEPDKAGLGMDVEQGWPVPYWDLDAAMGAMLLLLAAVDAGIGGWLFGVFYGEQPLLAELGVPPGRRLIGVVGLGWPAVGDRPGGSPRRRRRRPLDEVVHRGRW
jgi:nitroreductase